MSDKYSFRNLSLCIINRKTQKNIPLFTGGNVKNIFIMAFVPQ